MPGYGVFGFLLILIINLAVPLSLFKTGVFVKYYFPFIWLGFVLFVDSLVYKFRGNSLIKNDFRKFINLFAVSILFWIVFHLISGCVQLWVCGKIQGFLPIEYFILSSIVFSFVLPAIFEVSDLIGALTSFSLRTKRLSPQRLFLYLMILLGVASFIFPIFNPGFTFPLIWVSLFLIFDPINYLKGQPSIIKYMFKSEWEVPISLLISGAVCGFFWEFWNLWAYPKWSRAVPFFDFYRTFDVALGGYIFYFFFAWELFAMYHFIRFIGRSYLAAGVNFIKRRIRR